MNPEFVIDYDEVLVDFVGGACAVHSMPVESVKTWFFYKEQWGMTSDEFWNPIHALGDDFYGEYVKPLPWAERLLERLAQNGKFIIATSPGMSKPIDYSGKRVSVDKHFSHWKLRLNVGSDKDWYATPNRMLIDDNDETINKFIGKGGWGLTMPHPWNAAKGYIPTRLDYVNKRIDNFVGAINGYSSRR